MHRNTEHPELVSGTKRSWNEFSLTEKDSTAKRTWQRKTLSSCSDNYRNWFRISKKKQESRTGCYSEHQWKASVSLVWNLRTKFGSEAKTRACELAKQSFDYQIDSVSSTEWQNTEKFILWYITDIHLNLKQKSQFCNRTQFKNKKWSGK